MPRAPHHLPAHALFAALLLAVAVPAAARDAEPEPACRQALDEADRRAKVAGYAQALELYEGLLEEAECRLEAKLGIAEVLCHTGKRDKARKLAQEVLAETGDPRLLAEAHFQLGLALHERGRAYSKRKQQAEAAFLEALGLDPGHRRAVRELLWLFEDTSQEVKLWDLQQRYPDAGILTRTGAELEPQRPARAAGFDPAAYACHLTGESPPAEGMRYPAKLFAPQPRYPEDARGQRLGGVVKLEIVVDDGGFVADARVLEGLHPSLDREALRAVRQWRFSPARSADGQAIPCLLRGTIKYRLE